MNVISTTVCTAFSNQTAPRATLRGRKQKTLLLPGTPTHPGQWSSTLIAHQNHWDLLKRREAQGPSQELLFQAVWSERTRSSQSPPTQPGVRTTVPALAHLGAIHQIRTGRLSTGIQPSRTSQPPPPEVCLQFSLLLG